MEFDFNTIFNLALFIVPGYVTLYVMSLLIDYISERNQLDRTIQYLFFSLICHILTIIVFALTFGLLSLFSIIDFSALDLIVFLKSNLIFLTIVAVIIAPILGFWLGLYYFGKGYPHKHFRGHTNKKYTPSVYSEFFLGTYKNGAWVTCHMKDGTLIQGKLKTYDKDEEKRDYVIVLEDVEKHFLKEESHMKLHGDKVVINLKDTFLTEFNK